MKQQLSAIARSGLLALGLSVLAMPAGANAPGRAGSTVSGAVERAASETLVAKVDHRRRYYRGKGRYYRPRYVRPRTSFYLQFGTPGFYAGPGFYYGRPRYARPYYDRPYYPRRVYRGRVRVSRAHVDWCYSRYRSYRASDNTFQPYNGPRRPCYSPYSR